MTVNYQSRQVYKLFLTLTLTLTLTLKRKILKARNTIK